MIIFNLDEGRKLVRIARDTIKSYLEKGEKPEFSDEELSGVMKDDRGVFVTLKKGDELRGCIGRPLPTQSLIEGVIESAISAAVRDPRFPSLRLEEMEEITVEVSVMTVPRKIEVEDAEQYLEEVKVGRDGLIIKKGGMEGLLLPQVPVEQNWNAKEFLSHTCVKAGLPPKCWLESGVEIKKFSAQIFKEKKPEGKVIEEKIFL